VAGSVAGVASVAEAVGSSALSSCLEGSLNGDKGKEGWIKEVRQRLREQPLRPWWSGQQQGWAQQRPREALIRQGELQRWTL